MGVNNEMRTSLIAGTAISIIFGLVAGYLWDRGEIGFIVGLNVEILSLIIVMFSRVKEIKEEISMEIEESTDMLAIAKKIAEKDDPIFTKKYSELLWELNELAAGRYTLELLEDVYLDDKNSIMLLRAGDVVRSTCPISRLDVSSQIKNKFYLLSMEEHINAANRGVSVIRIYIFPNRQIFELDEVQKNLSVLVQAGVDVRTIFWDDPRYKGIENMEPDFLIFGEKKVSVGEIDTKEGIVKKARIITDPKTVSKYIRYFETFVNISDKYGVS